MEMESSGLIPHAIYIFSTTPILDASQEKGDTTVFLDPPMNCKFEPLFDMITSMNSKATRRHDTWIRLRRRG